MRDGTEAKFRAASNFALCTYAQLENTGKIVTRLIFGSYGFRNARCMEPQSIPRRSRNTCGYCSGFPGYVMAFLRSSRLTL